MGNVKFLNELMKLTSDAAERRAGVRIAAGIGCITHSDEQAAKRFMCRLASAKTTVFDHVERFDEDEMESMLAVLTVHGGSTAARVDSPTGTARLPGLEGTIKPMPKVKVKRDTVINRVRLWLLTEVPKGATVTVKGINSKFGLRHETTCSIIDSLRADRALRRKRDLSGGFQRGAYVRTGSICEATLRRRLRGKCVR